MTLLKIDFFIGFSIEVVKIIRHFQLDFDQFLPKSIRPSTIENHLTGSPR